MATHRKHWFRVADSIQFEPWDNDLLATFVRLSAHMNTRWARDGRTPEEAATISLGPAQVAAICGKRRRDVAETLLSRLAEVTSMSVARRGDVTEIHWPKFPIFQRYQAGTGAASENDSRAFVPPPTPTPTPTPTVRVKPPSIPPPSGGTTAIAPEAAPKTEQPAKRRRQRLPGVPAPEALSAEQQASLDAWCRRAEPEMLAELPRIAARLLDWGRSKGEIRPDWVATIRNAVRSEADRRRERARIGTTRGLRELPFERGPRGGGAAPF